jgi:hypothetical protein
MTDFKAKIEEHKERFEKALSRAKDEKSLQEVRNAFMSRKRGELKLLFEELKTLKPQLLSQALARRGLILPSPEKKNIGGLRILSCFFSRRWKISSLAWVFPSKKVRRLKQIIIISKL